MKNLLKSVALWLVKILGINLVEPYTLEHLKHMIHNLTDDISTFKYKPFFVKFEANNYPIQFYAAFLIDAKNKDGVDRIVMNISSSLARKGYYLIFDYDNDICEYVKPATNTIARINQLADDSTFEGRIKKSIKKIGKSQSTLEIDILSGMTQVINRTAKLPVEANPHYKSIRISVIEY